MLGSASTRAHLFWALVVGGAAAVVIAFAAGCGSTDSEGGTPASTGGTVSGLGGTTAASGANGLGGDVAPSSGGAAAIEAVGEVGVLGDLCSPAAALACAGNYQKVTLVCGASGTWEVNETCPGDQVCDSRPGLNAGTCQDQHPDCIDYQPGYRYCTDEGVFECDADNVDTALVQSCSGLCEAGVCYEGAYPCPTADYWINCAQDCAGQSDECPTNSGCPGPVRLPVYDGDASILRMPASEDACTCPDGRRYVSVAVEGESQWVGTYLVVAAPPWFIVNGPSCDSYGTWSCFELDISRGESHDILLATEDPTAAPKNITVEFWADTPVCP